MSIPLKTTISCREDIFDMEGQWLPKETIISPLQICLLGQ